MLKSIAFIPDGNRRFARKNRVNFTRAYAAGFDKTRDVFEWCIDTPNLKELTMWTISTENLQRKSAELSVFTRLLYHKLNDAKTDPLLVDNSVRVNIIGRLELLPQKVQEAASQLMQSTVENTGYVLNLAIGYGGRQEMLDAVQLLTTQNLPVTEENLSKCMYTQVQPDLIVRTGGEQRLSGFLPWQSTYSELYFSEKLWSEFDRNEFDVAINSFNSRERRFGR